MLNIVTILAAAAAVQAPAPAVPHTLQTLPGTKIHRFNLPGQSGDALEKSLKAAMKAQPTTIGQLFTWTASINVTNETVGSVCTIKSATATLDANVYLPELTEETKIPAEDLGEWRTYDAGLQKNAADNLWFVAERLPTIERSLVGKPCDQAATVWNDGIKTLIAQQQAFDAQLAKQNPQKAKPKKNVPDFNQPSGGVDEDSRNN